MFHCINIHEGKVAALTLNGGLKVRCLSFLGSNTTMTQGISNSCRCRASICNTEATVLHHSSCYNHKEIPVHFHPTAIYISFKFSKNNKSLIYINDKIVNAVIFRHDSCKDQPDIYTLTV